MMLSAVRRAQLRTLHTTSWSVPVRTDGTLRVRLPTACTLRIGTRDVMQTDAWEKAEVSLQVESRKSLKRNLTEADARRVADEFGLSVSADLEPGKDVLLVEKARETAPAFLGRLLHLAREWIGGPFKNYRPQYDSNVIVDVRLPGKFSLDLEVFDGAVEVQDTFEGDIKLLTEYADVNINRLKSTFVDIESVDGDISAVVLQGNVYVRTSQGNIDIAKAQGPSIKINTRDGDVQARALYAEYASIRSSTGNVRLGGAQGRTNIRTAEGSVEVSGVEGKLVVESDSGDVEAQLSVPQNVSLRSRTGDIAISVPQDLRAEVMFEASEKIDVDSAISIAEATDSTMDSQSVESSSSEAAVESRSKLRGWIGETLTATSATAFDQEPAIFARAPSGEISVNPGTWAGLRTNFAGSSKSPSFPRWAAAYPPPVEPVDNAEHAGESARASA